MVLLILISFFIGSTMCAIPGPRIIGGTNVTDRNQFAYQASLLDRGAPYCGGTIIDKKHILTAAHCCLNQNGRKLPTSDITVAVGNLDLYNRSVVKKVQNIFVHEKYDSQRLYNDIAVIRIVGNFTKWTDQIRPINLTTTKTLSGNCIVSGWGTTIRISEKQPMTRWLQYAEVPIVDWTLCNKHYSVQVHNSIGENVICAGNSQKDSCFGDSGGPLVCSNTLSGIVSYGPQKCALQGYPGVYTEVAKYIDWIEVQKRRSSSVMNKTTPFILFLTIFLKIAELV